MIGAIILAAGSSRRFGAGDKRTAKLPSGKTVIQQSVENVLATFDNILVVLRYGDNVFEDELHHAITDPKIQTFKAPESALGMGHSLANAIHEVPDWDFAFIFLADMPHIETATVEQLKVVQQDNADKAPIIVPVVEGRYGHPVGFDKAYFAEIAKLTGDHGAKPVIHAHEDKLIEVAVDDPGVLQDVDTPEDLSSTSG